MQNPESDQTLATENQFCGAIADSIEQQRFVRVALGKYSGAEQKHKLTISPVVVKQRQQLKFLQRFQSRDITKIYDIGPGLERIRQLLGTDFRDATLFTVEFDSSISFNRHGVPKLVKAKPTYASLPSESHNREKKRLITQDRPYLSELGITSADGKIKSGRNKKFVQIAKFIEIIDGLLADQVFSTEIRILDIGSGKGYLTFALYDYLTNIKGVDATICGVELRNDLVELCNNIANKLKYQNLHFESSRGSQFESGKIDMLIALHACDTATDEAIAKGVHGGAKYIVCAPCCHHQLAGQISKSQYGVDSLFRFGILKNRYAEILTDLSRALIMEAKGYSTKIIEFVSTEHTDKNLLLIGEKTKTEQRDSLERYYALKRDTGFETHELETLMLADAISSKTRS